MNMQRIDFVRRLVESRSSGGSARLSGLLAVTGALVIGVGLIVGAMSWLSSSGAFTRMGEVAAGFTDDVVVGGGFTVERVTVGGRERTSPALILQALDIQIGDSMFDLDLSEMKERLEQQGWVGTAAIQRRWPDQVHVELHEREPVALWQFEGRIALVDAVGNVITDSEIESFSALPLIVGAGANLEIASLLETLALAPELAHRVDAATRVGMRRWNLRMDNGIDVRLPEDDVATAWIHFVELNRRHQVMDRDLEIVDLRTPGRTILRLTEEGLRNARTPGQST